MPQVPPPDPLAGPRLVAVGSLVGLAIPKVTMLFSLFTRTPPYPPLALTPLFGASLALSALCLALIGARSRWFAVPAVAIVLESLLSFGPQKLYPGESAFFAQSVAVYPAVVVGSAPIALLVGSGWRLWRADAAGRTRPASATGVAAIGAEA